MKQYRDYLEEQGIELGVRSDANPSHGSRFRGRDDVYILEIIWVDFIPVRGMHAGGRRHLTQGEGALKGCYSSIYQILQCQILI